MIFRCSDIVSIQGAWSVSGSPPGRWYLPPWSGSDARRACHPSKQPSLRWQSCGSVGPWHVRPSVPARRREHRLAQLHRAPGSPLKEVYQTRWRHDGRTFSIGTTTVGSTSGHVQWTERGGAPRTSPSAAWGASASKRPAWRVRIACRAPWDLNPWRFRMTRADPRSSASPSITPSSPPVHAWMSNGRTRVLEKAVSTCRPARRALKTVHCLSHPANRRWMPSVQPQSNETAHRRGQAARRDESAFSAHKGAVPSVAIDPR